MGVVVHIRLIYYESSFLVLLCLVALTLASSMNLHRDAHKGAVAPVLKAEGSCHCHCPVITWMMMMRMNSVLEILEVIFIIPMNLTHLELLCYRLWVLLLLLLFLSKPC